MQSDVEVENGVITGELNFIEGGLADSGPLAGDGWFVALKWSDPDPEVTSMKVGLVPSASGMAPQECIEDTDRNGVFKISDTLNQQLIFYFEDANGKKGKQRFDLDFTLLEE